MQDDYNKGNGSRGGKWDSYRNIGTLYFPLKFFVNLSHFKN